MKRFKVISKDKDGVTTSVSYEAYANIDVEYEGGADSYIFIDRYEEDATLRQLRMWCGNVLCVVNLDKVRRYRITEHEKERENDE